MRPAGDTRLGNIPAKYVLSFMADQANADGFGYPSLGFIAHQTEINIRTVRRVFQVFIEMGLVTKVNRGPRRAPGFQLNLELLGKDLTYEFALAFAAAQSHSKSGLTDLEEKVSQTAGVVSQTDKTVSGTGQTVSQTVPPHPHIGRPAKYPLRSHHTQALAIERSVEAVMQGCSFVSSDIRLTLRSVVEQEADKGEDPPTTALKMIASWHRYTSQGDRLRSKWGAKRFFGEGYWDKPESWPWDATVLREEIRRKNF
jgi:hypothetical protein